MGKINVGEAVTASFRYVSSGWRGAWGILMIAVWVTAVFQAIETMRPDLAIVLVLGEIVAVVVGAAAYGALYRLTLQENHPGDEVYRAHEAGLQWGAIEWRVLGANVIGFLIGVVAALGAAIVWVVALVAVVASHASDLGNLNSSDPTTRATAFAHVFLGPGALVTVLILIPAFCGLVYLAARLLLYPLSAADGGGFDLGKAWALTRGAVAPIVLALIVIGFADLAAAGVCALVAGVIGALVGGGSAAQLWAGIASAAVVAGVGPPLGSGLQLYVYRARSADPAVAETFR